MKPSGIGGQALIEGIMMRHEDEYSVAVRKPDQEIVVKKEPFQSVVKSRLPHRIPLIRGMIAFVDSLKLGIETLMYSAEFVEEDEEGAADEPVQAKEQRRPDSSSDEKAMTAVFFVSLIMAVFLFMMLPYFLTGLITRNVHSNMLVSLIEAGIRVAIFLAYLILISRMKDIQRTFMYHGAEHKCINCIEHGHALTVENVMKSSRFHKRCGTSFLFIIVIITAVLLMFVQTDSRVMRIVWRLILIPVIAGISYELLRLNGRYDNAVTNLLSKPGLALQRLTTSEPDESMAEVAIQAVEAVFDWRSYLSENFADTGEIPVP